MTAAICKKQHQAWQQQQHATPPATPGRAVLCDALVKGVPVFCLVPPPAQDLCSVCQVHNTPWTSSTADHLHQYKSQHHQAMAGQAGHVLHPGVSNMGHCSAL